ncbi:hypothetical protein CKA32_003707 [Geitlerinema sp. FC II]|nr:hypothetical protein CKA32_003707 [Geitlerinema sp. FC II]
MAHNRQLLKTVIEEPHSYRETGDSLQTSPTFSGFALLL